MKIEIIRLGEDRPKNAKRGLFSAIQAAKTFNSKITIVVGSKRKFPISFIKCFLSEHQAERLIKNEQVQLNDGTELILESIQTITKEPITPVLLLVYGWSEAIPKIRRTVGVEALIVLAPNEEEATIWENTFKKNLTDKL